MTKKSFTLWVLPLFGVIIHIFSLLALPTNVSQNQNSDFIAHYLPAAQNLITGHGLTVEGKIDTLYPPGYPLVIAAFLLLAKIFFLSQSFMLRLMVALSMYLSLHIIGKIGLTIFDIRFAWVPAGLLMVNPLYLMLSKQPNSEMVFIPVVLLGLHYSLIQFNEKHSQVSSACLSGLCYAFATLIRPNALFLPFLLQGYYYIRKSRTKQRARAFVALTGILSFFLLLTPWSFITYFYTGNVVMVSTNGTPGMLDGLQRYAGRDDNIGHSPVHVSQEVSNFAAEIIDAQGTSNNTTNLMRLMIVESIEHPIAALKLLTHKALACWYKLDFQNEYEYLIIVIQLLYLIPALFGIFLAFQQRILIDEMLIILIFALNFWIMAIMVVPLVRYMLPLLPILILPSALVVQRALRLKTRPCA